MTDFSRHLTSEAATDFFKGPLFFEGKEKLFQQTPELQFAASIIRNTRVVLLYDDETGCGPHMNVGQATKRINKHIAQVNDGTLPANAMDAERTRSLFAGKPACFFNTDLGKGVAFFRLPNRKASLAEGLAKISGLPKQLISDKTHLRMAEMDNLFLLMQLRLLADELVVNVTNGAYQAYSSVATAQAICFHKAQMFFEAHGGTPVAAETYKAARMVECIVGNVMPLELLGFMNPASLQHMLPQMQLDIYCRGQECPPTSTADMMRAAYALSSGAPIKPSVLAKGLKGTIDGLLETGVYKSLPALLADYAVFHRHFMNPAQPVVGDKDYLKALNPQKISALGTFHILSGTLVGLRHLTGDHFKTLCADRSVDSLLQSIRFAQAHTARPS